MSALVGSEEEKMLTTIEENETMCDERENAATNIICFSISSSLERRAVVVLTQINLIVIVVTVIGDAAFDLH